MDIFLGIGMGYLFQTKQEQDRTGANRGKKVLLLNWLFPLKTVGAGAQAEVKMDPSVFFSLLFGSERFEPWIGELLLGGPVGAVTAHTGSRTPR